MPLTDPDDIQALIIALVGDVDVNGLPVTGSTGVIASNIENVWEQYDGKPLLLQQLYTHRDAIDLVLARLKNRVNTQVGNIQTSKSQAARTLLQMRGTLVSRIIAAERAIAIGTSAVIAPIETVVPVVADDRYTFVRDLR